MGTPKPPGRFVDQLLGPYWESSITVESLMAFSTALTGASQVMKAESGDGLAGAQKMMNSGTGMLVNAISLTWAEIFVEVGLQGGQVAAAGVAVGAAQTALANAQFAMAGTAELYNGLLEEADAERKAGIEGADERFNSLLTQGKKAIEGISGSAAQAIPVWLSNPGNAAASGGTGSVGEGASGPALASPASAPSQTSVGTGNSGPSSGQTGPPSATPVRQQCWHGKQWSEWRWSWFRASRAQHHVTAYEQRWHRRAGGYANWQRQRRQFVGAGQWQCGFCT